MELSDSRYEYDGDCHDEIGHEEMKNSEVGGRVYNEKMKLLYFYANDYDDKILDDVYRPIGGDTERFETFNLFYDTLLVDLDLCIDKVWNSTSVERNVPIGDVYVYMEVISPYEIEEPVYITPDYDYEYKTHRYCYENIYSMREGTLLVFGIPSIIAGIVSVISAFIEMQAIHVINEMKGDGVTDGELEMQSIPSQPPAQQQQVHQMSPQTPNHPQVLYMMTPSGLTPVGTAGGGLPPINMGAHTAVIHQQQQYAQMPQTRDVPMADATYAVALQAEEMRGKGEIVL